MTVLAEGGKTVEVVEAKVSEVAQLVKLMKTGHPGASVCVGAADIGRLMEVCGSDNSDDFLANSKVKIVYPAKT